MFYLLNIWTLTRKSPTRPWTPHTQRSTTYAYHRLLYQFAYAILASIDGHPSGYFFPVTEGDKGRAEVLKNLLKNSGSSTSNTRRNSGKNKDNWEGKDKDKNKDEDSEDSGEDKDKDDDEGDEEEEEEDEKDDEEDDDEDINEEDDDKDDKDEDDDDSDDDDEEEEDDEDDEYDEYDDKDDEDNEDKDKDTGDNGCDEDPDSNPLIIAFHQFIKHILYPRKSPNKGCHISSKWDIPVECLFAIYNLQEDGLFKPPRLVTQTFAKVKYHIRGVILFEGLRKENLDRVGGSTYR